MKHTHLIQSRISPTSKSTQTSTLLRSSVDDDISRTLAKAKQLLEKAKAKVAEEENLKQKKQQKQQQPQEEDTEQQQEIDTVTTIVATADKVETSIDKKASVTKSTNDSGLITTDGDLMAAMSEEEDWELKSLMDVFEDENDDGDATSKLLADRDVAASIFNLRMSMHNGDYRRIFDKRNRFIGEDN